MSELLRVNDLSVVYDTATGPVVACEDVSFGVLAGRTLGVAGESGSGKSSLIMAVARLERSPARIAAGSIEFRDRDGAYADLASMTEQQLRRYRWREISVVMQSAMQALNPVMRLDEQFIDAIRAADKRVSRRAAAAQCRDLLELVSIPGDRSESFIHELSGGMRQRATIALALACDPRLVVLDEPTTAVDVIVQRNIMERIQELQRERGFAMIFVTHDLNLLLEISDHVAIMRDGRIVEMDEAETIYRRPAHPYTRQLRDAFPPLHSAFEREIVHD